MIDRGAAFKAERAEVLRFCESLGPADWRMNSRAAGWSITDVVAHMASGCHAMFTPSVRRLMRADSIEQANEQLVGVRRDRNPTQVLGEYLRWSKVFGAVVPPAVRGPMGRIRTPLAELGEFPMQLLLSAAVFDHHTHLRHDMAPALGRRSPDTDANRMATVLEWMVAVLSNQLTKARPDWLDRPLSITLSGPGGGAWLVETGGSITPGDAGNAAARISGVALEFPEWGTRRAGWRERDVEISGDVGYATRFLDTVDIV